MYDVFFNDDDNKKKLIGDMTDIRGFENSIKALDLDIKNKNFLSLRLIIAMFLRYI